MFEAGLNSHPSRKAFCPQKPRTLVHVEVAELNKSSESEERYVEAINSITREHGYARVADLATKLDVKPPSVTNMLKKLDEQKFVTYTRYRGVTLSKKGKMLAATLERRHQALKDLLIIIGVSEKNAEEDACEIEHSVNPETIEKLSKFVDFVQAAPKPFPLLERFKYYNKTGKRLTVQKQKESRY